MAETISGNTIRQKKQYHHSTFLAWKVLFFIAQKEKTSLDGWSQKKVFFHARASLRRAARAKPLRSSCTRDMYASSSSGAGSS